MGLMCKACLLTPQHFLPLLWPSYPRPFFFFFFSLFRWLCCNSYCCSCCDCISIFGLNSRLPHALSYLIPYVQTVVPHFIIPIRAFSRASFWCVLPQLPLLFLFYFLLRLQSTLYVSSVLSSEYIARITCWFHNFAP